jgi:methylglutaconyl-CoA hydratase
MSRILEVETSHGGLAARLWLNRPEVHNALNAELVAALTDMLRGITLRSRERVVVLGGRGPSFCAGGDIGDMRAAGTASMEENRAEATRLAALFAAVAECPRPVVARVHGNVFGGGTGLAAAADLAVGTRDAVFAISEVRLGIMPGVISPYLLRRMGDRFARPLMLTGHRFDGVRAAEVGLLHRAVEPAALDATVDKVVGELLAGGPHAQARVKEVLRLNAESHFAEVVRLMPGLLAEVRATDEAREGFTAFFEKRKPAWAAEAEAAGGGSGGAGGRSPERS